jgi:chromosome segregation ATPase
MRHTPENAVAIKRDVANYQRQLSELNELISQRKQELTDIETQKTGLVAEQARANSKSIIDSIEESVLSFFKKKKREIKDITAQEKDLKSVIKKLQFHRAVLAAEIAEAPLPDNRLSQLDNAIKLMRENLSRILSQTDATEEELAHLIAVKENFENEVAVLAEDEEKLNLSLAEKQTEIDRIDAQREAILAELVKEKALQAQLSERNQDVAAMQYRLSEEYTEVFNRTPSRTNR